MYRNYHVNTKSERQLHQGVGIMKKFIQTKCFWFQEGNSEVAIGDGDNTNTLIIEAQKAGCRLREYDIGIQDCNGICPQFVTYDKETVNMLNGKGGQAGYPEAVEWQKKGRKKKLKEKKK